MAAPPLEMKLHISKSRWLCGEGVIFEVWHRALAALEMEPVSLNDEATRIEILGPGAEDRQILTGQSHRDLHQPDPMEALAQPFRVAAGQSWISDVELLHYTRPLRPGHYRARLSYQCGGPGETVDAGEVAFAVAPVTLEHWAPRLMNGAEPKSQLEVFWTAREGGRRHGFYQGSSEEPSAPLFSSLLDLELAWTTPPVLAEIDDIAAFHFERWLLWIEGGQLHLQSIHKRGAIVPRISWLHGLDAEPPPRIANPPRQMRDGRVAALLLGARDGSTVALRAVFSPAEAAIPAVEALHLGESDIHGGVVLWNEAELEHSTLIWQDGAQRLVWTPLTGEPASLLCAGLGDVVQLVQSQGQGRGQVMAVLRREGFPNPGARGDQILSWSRPDATEIGAYHALEAQERGPMAAAAAPDGEDLFLLYRNGLAWCVRDRHGATYASADGALPLMVATPEAGLELLSMEFKNFWAALEFEVSNL